MNTMLTKIRVGVLLPAFLLYLAFLAGCGRDTAKNNTSVTVTAAATATQTPTPTPEREPKDYVLSDLYETVGKSTVYRLLEGTVGKGAVKDGVNPADRKSEIEILDVQSAGDYVLAFLCDPEYFSETMKGEYVLFHLGRPDLTRRFIPSYRESNARLLADGTVVMEDTDSELVRVYNREFEEVGTVAPKEGREGYLLDISEDGLLWVVCTAPQKTLTAIDLQGNCVGEYTYAGDSSVYSYCCLTDGVRYFRGMDSNYLVQPLVLLPGATELTPIAGEPKGTDIEGILACETADVLWYIHKLGDTENELYFPKAAFREGISKWSGVRFLTWGEAAQRCDKENGVVKTAVGAPRALDFRVYDFDARTLCGELLAEELPQYTNLYAKSMTDRGYVLFAGRTETGADVLLWDVNRETAKPIEGVSFVAVEPVAEHIAKRIAEIEEEYGIRIHYDKKSVEECVFAPWYTIEPMTSERKVLGYVETVAYYLKLYPKTIWREMLSDDRDGLDMYLVNSLESIGMQGFSAGGCVQTYSANLAVAFAQTGLDGGPTTFAHETMHLLEHRIFNYCIENGINWDNYWAAERTSEKYPYTRGDSEPVNDGVFRGAWWYGVEERGIDPNDVWYTRTYGMWNELEDRATLMEELYAENRKMLDAYPHLREKAEDVCAVIRAAFPCVAASTEPLFWERATGIVQPADRMADWSRYPALSMD